MSLLLFASLANKSHILLLLLLWSVCSGKTCAKVHRNNNNNSNNIEVQIAFFGRSPYRDIPRPTGDLLSRYSTMQCPSQLTEIAAALDAASRIRFLIAAVVSCSVEC